MTISSPGTSSSSGYATGHLRADAVRGRRCTTSPAATARRWPAGSSRSSRPSVSTSSAMPVWIAPPGSSTRTAAPRREAGGAVVGAQPGGVGVAATGPPRRLAPGQRRQQRDEHLGLPDVDALGGERGRPRLVGGRGGDVEPDADDHRGPLRSATSARMPATLRCAGPSSRSLGHLRPHGTAVERAHGVVGGEPGEQRQPAEPRRGHAVGAQQHADREPGAGRRDPAPREPPRPASWCSAIEHGAVGGARGGGGEQVGVGGAGAVDDVHPRPETDERGADGVVVERPAVRFMRADATGVGVIRA